MWTKKQHHSRPWWRSQLLISVLLLVGLAFLLPQVFSRNQQRLRIETEIESLKQEAAAAEAKNYNLKKMVEYLESQEFLEEQARLNFNLKKPGETVVVVKDSPPDGGLAALATSSASSSSSLALPGNYGHWFEYFFAPKR